MQAEIRGISVADRLARGSVVGTVRHAGPDIVRVEVIQVCPGRHTRSPHEEVHPEVVRMIHGAVTGGAQDPTVIGRQDNSGSA